MYRIFFILLALAFIVATITKKLFNNAVENDCGHLMRNDYFSKCCNEKIPSFPKPSDDFNECHRKYSQDKSVSKQIILCNLQKCIAEKVGFASSDGTIYTQSLAEQIEMHFEGHEDIIERILDNCVTEDLSGYGMRESCDVIKLDTCIKIQYLKSCENNWNNQGICKEVKTMTEKCTQYFDKTNYIHKDCYVISFGLIIIKKIPQL